MKKITLLLFIITSSVSFAQGTKLEWAKSMGGTSGTSGESAKSIAIDASGNVYTTGGFHGTVDFDPGAGVSNLISAGNTDIFISKLDANGNFVWAKRMGGTSYDIAYSIAIDASGNVYTTGHFYGTADFDPGTGVSNLTSAGFEDIFISKLDANGNFVWAKRMGGTSVDEANSIAIDASGNVYTTGFFNGTADFDPGAGVSNLISAGNTDIFISKLDANGNFVWAKRMGGTEYDGTTSIAIDASGNVYTTGRFWGTADFDPGAGVSNLASAGNTDIFISKLDANGNFVWAKRMGGTSNDIANSITIDASGNVYTTGIFRETADFDPGAGVSNLTSAGHEDIFISKLDANGNFVWAKSMGDTFFDDESSIAIDASGNVYTTGSFWGTVDFDPGAGISNLISAGESDIFISKLDANGNFVWAKRMGGTSSDIASSSIAIDAAGNVYTTGYFSGTVDFDPGAGVSNLISAGESDIFISKLSQYDLSLSIISTNEPISIYPNPTEGNLTIDFKNKPFSKIEIYSLTGQKVKEVTEYESIKNGKINLNIANLEPSIYLVKIGETNFKITKQ